MKYLIRDPRPLEPFFSEHMMAMTEEGLHDKGDIARELAFRDKQIATLKEFLQHWISDGHLQTFADRERFRAVAKALLELEANEPQNALQAACGGLTQTPME